MSRLSRLRSVARLFHVTSVDNRASITEHGLDWTRMSAARGIAGSRRPEQEGCFLAADWEIDWFVQMNNTGGPVDVWAVEDVDQAQLLTSPEGFHYLPERIPADRLSLVRRDIGQPSRPCDTGS
jgi:hypothetical protein